MAYTDIDKPSDYFNTVLYTGNGGTLTVSGVGFQSNFTWLKGRSFADYHVLTDSVRGVNSQVYSNDVAVQGTQTNGITSFNSDGFVLGNWSNTNKASQTHVAWNWKAETSFTNDASGTGIGDIDSSGSVNTDAGFSIITATSDSAADKNIAHGLGVVPDVILSKNLASTFNWDCYFKTLGYNASLQLNQTAAPRTGAWGSATFTSTTFQTNDNFSSENGSPYIYYCFAEKQGYSKFGSYVGNGNVSGSYIHLGFKPAFVILKKTSATDDWHIFDNKRDVNNMMETNLIVNRNIVESTTMVDLDFVSNGFKLRNTDDNGNASGSTYIYMAFAESPFVTSTGVPATAR